MLHRCTILVYCYSMSTSVTLNTEDSRIDYMTAALTYAAEYKGSRKKYKAMVAEFPEVNLKKCMSLCTIRKRVARSITDGKYYGKGGSRAGAGRRRKRVLVEGETRKNTMSRLRMRVLRKETKEAENIWRGHTFPPFLAKLANDGIIVEAITTLASAARVCFSSAQDMSPVYKNGRDLSYINDLIKINKAHGTPTTGQQRRLLFPTAAQRHKEQLSGPIIQLLHSHTHYHTYKQSYTHTCMHTHITHSVTHTLTKTFHCSYGCFHHAHDMLHMKHNLYVCFI